MNILIEISLSPTSYANIAIPHAMQISGLSTKICVGVFKENFNWDEKYINLVLLIIIKEEDKDKFKNYFKELISIFTSEIWLENHKKINNFEDFISIFTL